MADIVEVENNDRNHCGRVTSRPTLAQVKAIVDFMQKHTDLAQWKLRYGVSRHNFKKLWTELSNIANSIDGATKTTKGWIKFWSDKRRSIILKQKQIEEGKIQGKVTALEQKILDLSGFKPMRKKRKGKEKACNGDVDEDSLDILFSKEEEQDEDLDNLFANENEEQHLNIMEKLVVVMGQQASAMAQVAQAQLDHSKALERLAEASHIQALAVDRMASSFENISSSVLDVRNAILGIDYTMKRCYPTNASQQRQNSNIFS